MTIERLFVVDLLKGIKNYYQDFYAEQNEKSNKNIYLGYCKGCNSIEPISIYEKRNLSLDERLNNPSINPLKKVHAYCYEHKHTNVIRFSSKDMRNIINYFKENFFSEFIFLLNKWPNNNDYINEFESHVKLSKLYEQWNRFNTKEKQDQLKNLIFHQAQFSSIQNQKL